MLNIPNVCSCMQSVSRAECLSCSCCTLLCCFSLFEHEPATTSAAVVAVVVVAALAAHNLWWHLHEGERKQLNGVERELTFQSLFCGICHKFLASTRRRFLFLSSTSWRLLIKLCFLIRPLCVCVFVGDSVCGMHFPPLVQKFSYR